MISELKEHKLDKRNQENKEHTQNENVNEETEKDLLKRTKQILGLKSMVTELKKQEQFKRRFNQKKEPANLETGYLISSQRDKKKSEENLRDLWDTIKQANTLWKREKGVENLME